jgi:hypothetical protein
MRRFNMARLFLEVKNDDSAETWTMEGGRQYLVVKKEDIVTVLDGDGIDAECSKIKKLGYDEAMKDMDKKIIASREWGRKLGRSDAWVLARKIACTYSSQQRKGMFGTAEITAILRGNTYSEAEDKVDEYLNKERNRAVEVKDYVGLPDHKLFGKTGVDIFQTAVVIRRIGCTLTVLRCDGITAQVSTNEVQRTGAICEDLNEFMDAWRED